MVLLHFKGPIEKTQFILEKTTSDEINDITKELCEMNNEFVLILTLLNNFEQVIKDAADEIKFEDDDLDEIRAVISENRIKQRQPTTPAELRSARFKLLEIIGSSGISFARAAASASATESSSHTEEDSQGWDQFMEMDSDSVGSQLRGTFDKDKAQLWFGSRKLEREKKLCDYKFIGHNEKSKLIVKLTKSSSSSMPVREGPVDAVEIRKNMMAIWHKKQEQDKELRRDMDNSYLYSKWSDPTSLRSSLTGISADSVRFR